MGMECWDQAEAIESPRTVSWSSSSLVAKSCPTLVTPQTVACQTPLPWDSPGKNTGVGCHFLLQGIFPTQESNPALLHCRQILYRLISELRVTLKVWQVSRHLAFPPQSQHWCPEPLSDLPSVTGTAHWPI